MSNVIGRTGSSQRGQSPQTFVAVMQEVRAAGMSGATLAKVVGASERTVQTWAAGTNKPSGVRAMRLLDVQVTLKRLGDLYTPEGIDIWLNSRNARFEMKRPIDLLTDGEIDRVSEEVEAMLGGW